MIYAYRPIHYSCTASKPHTTVCRRRGLTNFKFMVPICTDAVNPNLIWGEKAHIEPQSLRKYIQNEEETIDTIFTRCKLQALRCKFTQSELNERFIEQLIVGTIFPGLHIELLSNKEHLTLGVAIHIGRTHEASINHVAQLRVMQHNDVHSIKGNAHRLGSNVCYSKS